MKYLGIDQSLNGTGLCVLEEDGAVSRLITVNPGKLRDAARLDFVVEVMRPYLSSVAYAAFEGYSYGSVSQHFSLGEMGGVLRLAVWKAEIPYVEVAPASLKKFATGVAHAPKDMMIAAAKKAGAKPEDDNQADAYFLACVARNMLQLRMPLMRASIEVLHQLKNPKVKTTNRVRKLVKHAI